MERPAEAEAQQVKLRLPRLRTLTAAGTRVSRQREDAYVRRLRQPWQERAFTYYDMLGEIWYAAQFYARPLSKLRLYVAKLTDGEWEEIDTGAGGDDGKAVELLARVQDPGSSQRTQLQSSYGRLMFLNGEGLLLVTKNDDGGEDWELLSQSELRLEGEIYQRMRAPQLQMEQLREAGSEDWEPVPGTAVVYRLWRPHPKYSSLADCTMRGVLDLCEELLILSQAVRSRARSRLAGSGLLLVPDGVTSVPLEVVGDEDPNEDPVLRDITEAMMAPIADQGTASAVVPIILRGDAEALKDIRHVQIIDQMQFYPETGLRTECIQRMALGLDMPKEALLGLGDSNHWSAWQIDEQTWKAHIQPVAEDMVSDFTQSFFQPSLRKMSVQDPTVYSVRYDAADIVNHPDRTSDAKDLYDRRAIGKSALREAGGFSEEDAPPEAELAEMIGIAVRDGSLAWEGMPSVKSGGVETAPGEIATGENPEPGAATGAEVEKGPPPGGPPDVSGEVIGSVLGAAVAVTGSQRRTAGNRLRSYAKRDVALSERLNGEDNPFAHVTVTDLQSVGALPVTLVAGTTEAFAQAACQLGMKPESATFLGQILERHLALTLFEENSLPQSFANYAREALK